VLGAVAVAARMNKKKGKKYLVLVCLSEIKKGKPVTQRKHDVGTATSQVTATTHISVQVYLD